MYKLNKKVLALVFAFAMCLCSVSLEAFAATDYYQHWNDGKSGTYSYGNSSASSGNFSMNWSTSTGNIIEGKGWRTCDLTNLTIYYNMGLYTISGSAGCSYFSFYGWAKAPKLIEYYIVESWQNWRPTYTSRTTITVDGANYDVYTNSVKNAPSILGTSDFEQYWSVRQSKASTGTNNTITVKSHYNTWKNYGFPSSGVTWDYGVMAFEAYQSSGSGNATVWN